jgi:predicted transcriptional regulator of viral defense system
MKKIKAKADKRETTHRTEKEKLLSLLNSEEEIFSKEELLDKLNLAEKTLRCYLDEFKSKGLIDSINQSFFKNPKERKVKYYYYGNPDLIAKAKREPKEWEI